MVQKRCSFGAGILKRGGQNWSKLVKMVCRSKSYRTSPDRSPWSEAKPLYHGGTEARSRKGKIKSKSRSKSKSRKSKSEADTHPAQGERSVNTVTLTINTRVFAYLSVHTT